MEGDSLSSLPSLISIDEVRPYAADTVDVGWSDHFFAEKPGGNPDGDLFSISDTGIRSEIQGGSVANADTGTLAAAMAEQHSLLFVNDPEATIF